MFDENKSLDQLQSELADKKEDLFLCQQDLEKLRNENIALKNFIQTLYESCEGLEGTELSLEEVLDNLKDNIRRFSKDHQIYL
ncbi:hypothetical protein [Marinoscillum furvescens]|uniref:Uncharacterized protein n=1 Tax=Marinoscillum furvescens DSM 4134 TaxID=1122208 RepID=A0A3D9L6F5_MARFU|nr:hypothetical protein [Marinoscillum furvescens]REE01760.1 hypothetical protein C7460_103277 [Marinoscillum furvescens DSM 4134]